MTGIVLKIKARGMRCTQMREETTRLQDTPTPQTDNSIAGGMKHGDTDRAQATGRILISLFHPIKNALVGLRPQL
jgi:hypothetical protein